MANSKIMVFTEKELKAILARGFAEYDLTIAPSISISVICAVS